MSAAEQPATATARSQLPVSDDAFLNSAPSGGTAFPTKGPDPPLSKPSGSSRRRTLSKHAQEAARMVEMGFGRPEEGGVRGRVASWEDRRRTMSGSSAGSGEGRISRPPSRSRSRKASGGPAQGEGRAAIDGATRFRASSASHASEAANGAPTSTAAAASDGSLPSNNRPFDRSSPSRQMMSPDIVVEPPSAAKARPSSELRRNYSTEEGIYPPVELEDGHDAHDGTPSRPTPASSRMASTRGSDLTEGPSEDRSPTPPSVNTADDDATKSGLTPDLEDGEIFDDSSASSPLPPSGMEPVTPQRQSSGLPAIPEASPDSMRKGGPSGPKLPTLLTASAPPSAGSSSPLPPPTQDSPLTLLMHQIPSLPITEQRALQRTIKAISAFPPSASKTLPLNRSWTLFFSDTSSTAQSKVSSSRKAAAATAEYESAMEVVFTVRDVPALCGGLKAFKARVAQAVREGRMGASSGKDWAKKKGAGGAGGEEPTAVENPGMGLGLLAMKPGQNLHFFREGVRPVWEDLWNAKGGRIMITPSLAMLDQTYESMVLLVAGGVLDIDSSSPPPEGSPTPTTFIPGTVCGVVGSRRARGDRVELWLSGKDTKSPPDEAWVRRVQAVIAQEVGTPEAKAARFKRHFGG